MARGKQDLDVAGDIEEKKDHEILQLCVTEQDRYWSERSGLKNPILCALQRTTSTLWRLYEDGFAVETMPPYRSCQLPYDAVKQWHNFECTGQMELCEWEVELVPTHETDIYALIQHRQTSLHEKIGRDRTRGRIDWVG